LHLDAAAAGHPEVAELVNGDQDAEGDQGKENRLKCVYHLRVASTWRWARSLASLSDCRTHAKSTGSLPCQRSNTPATTWGIAVKAICPARKAATATSLAALRAAGKSPPLAAACWARRRQGKRSRSGASKSSRARPTRSRGSTPEAMRSGQARAWAMGVRISGLPSWASTEPST